MLTSSRRSLSYPNPATRADTADVPRDIATVIAALELDVVFSQGTHAARPAAGASAPAGTGGGRLYWETDTLQLFYDTGAAWIGPLNVSALAANSVTTAMLQDDSVTAAKIAAGAVGASEIADGTITAVELASTLSPAGGAADGTEALRALGTAAGQALSGNGRNAIRSGVGTNNRMLQTGKAATTGTVTITFPIAFTSVPTVVVTPLVSNIQTFITITAISTTQFSVRTVGSGAADVPCEVQWMAEGPAV